MNGRGYSLVELMTVLTIAGILAGLGITSFAGWRSKHDINTEIREVQADLMGIRMMSVTEGVAHFAELGASQVKAYEDADDNGALNTASDRVVCMWSRRYGEAVDGSCTSSQSVSTKNLGHKLVWSGSANIRFDAKGLADANNTICIDYSQTTPVNATYDCIDVSPTRINIGKMTDPGGACVSANCQAKK